MTVKWIDGTEAVCDWFDSEHNSMSNFFEMATLMLYVPPSPERQQESKQNHAWVSNVAASISVLV